MPRKGDWWGCPVCAFGSLEAQALPPGAVAVVTDEDGVVLAERPGPPRVGERYRGPLLAQLRGGGSGLVVEQRDDDGLDRVHAFHPVGGPGGRTAMLVAVGLLLTDVILPETNGPDLAARLAREPPGLRVLFTSGYTGGFLAAEDVAASGHAFLPKPFTPEALRRRVREVLDAPPPGAAPRQDPFARPG